MRKEGCLSVVHEEPLMTGTHLKVTFLNDDRYMSQIYWISFETLIRNQRPSHARLVKLSPSFNGQIRRYLRTPIILETAYDHCPTAFY